MNAPPDGLQPGLATARPRPPARPVADWREAAAGDWTMRDFRFHTGEVLPELHLHYQTIGAPGGEPVLLLHGTNGSGASLLTPAFAGELFGPDQPLDLADYFLILPDAIGSGQSSKPSDGLRTRFPRYNYADQVDAQYRLLREHLGVAHLRALLGYSMGGMQAWLWAEKHPDFIDLAVPLAALPTPMSGRNWMLRRLIIDSIRRDPDWLHGKYQQPPRSLQFATVFYGIAADGGDLALQRAAPTRELADQLLDQRLNAPFAGDANDHLYQWEAARDYDPSAGLGRIRAFVLVVASADDERNRAGLAVIDEQIRRVQRGRVLLIPAGEETLGHATATQAIFWKDELAKLLQTVPRRASASPM
jgi:homoserine O-acetyltransferase